MNRVTQEGAEDKMKPLLENISMGPDLCAEVILL